MKTIPRRGAPIRIHTLSIKARKPLCNNGFIARLFDVLHLLAHLFDLALQLDGELRERRVLRL